MDDFLNENPSLSPSKILQSKINEIIEARRINFREVRNLNKKIEHMAKLLQQAYEEKEDLQHELAKKNENQ